MKSTDCPGLTVGSRLKHYIDILLDDAWLDAHAATEESTGSLRSPIGSKQLPELSRDHII